MANGAVRGLKILLYLVVIGGSAGMLYGFVKATSSIDRCVFGGGNCVLFAHMANYSQHSEQPANMSGCGQSLTKESQKLLKSFNVPVSGSETLCLFCLGSSALQLTMCVLAVLVVYYRWSSDKPGRSGCSVVELMFVVFLTAMAVVTSALVSAGLQVFCDRLMDGWSTSFMSLHLNVAKPGACSSAVLFKFDNGVADSASVPFYAGMHIARSCSYVVAGAWLLHLVVSAISVHSYRVNGATPLEEQQSEQEKRRAEKEKKALKKKEKDLKKKEKAAKKSSSRSGGRRGKNRSAWDEGTEMV